MCGHLGTAFEPPGIRPGQDLLDQAGVEAVPSELGSNVAHEKHAEMMVETLKSEGS